MIRRLYLKKIILWNSLYHLTNISELFLRVIAGLVAAHGNYKNVSFLQNGLLIVQGLAKFF